MKKLFLFCFLNLFIVNNASASVEGAHEFANSLVSEIMTVASQGQDIDKTRNEIVEIVKRNVDINYISKFVLGKHWRRTNAAQRQKFADIYEEYLVLTYAPKFQGYSGETYKMEVTEELAPKKYVSKLSLIMANKASLDLEVFVIELEAENYKIVDISGEGISFAATQRSEFSSLIATRGVDRFLLQLEKKVHNLKAKNQKETQQD